MMRWLPIAVVLALAAAPVAARKPATIGSLDSRDVDVDVEPGEAPRAEFIDAIASYREFLELASPGDPLRAQALRRLADLELERRELKVMNGEPIDAASPDPAALYRDLLATWPDRDDNDAVLYQLARATELNGDTAATLAVLDRLVVEFPSSPYVGEAQFRRGEAHFVARRFAAAERAYGAVLALGEAGDFAAQARYKHGWSLYRQSMYPEAIDSFLAVLDRHLVGSVAPEAMLEATGRAGREMIDDTRRVLALSFANLPGDDPIGAHLAKAAPRSYEHLLYERQGDLYLDQERYSDAADTYADFVARRPAHARAPHLQMRAIAAYEAGGFADLVLVGKREFVRHYGLDAPFWTGRSRDAAPDVLAYLKTNVIDLARHHHALAQAGDGGYTEAIHWYRRFLVYFRDEPEAPGTHFLLAEIVHDSGDMPGAAAEYERAAYDYGAHERAAESGYAAILAWGAAADAAVDPVAIDRARLDSGLKFVATFPDHPQAAAVLTASAEGLFAAGDLAGAVEAAAGIASLGSATAAQVVTGLVVTGHAQFDMAGYALAEPAYRQALGLLTPDDTRRDELTERLAATIYRQGEAARAAGDLLAAAAHFLRIGQETPAASIRAGADYDAAVAFLDLGDTAGAIPVLESFRDRHAGHELEGDVTRRLAAAYIETGQLAHAGDQMLLIASDTGEAADTRRQALLESASLYERASDTARVRATLADYVARYPFPEDVALETRQKLADLAGAAGDRAERSAWLDELVRAHETAAAPTARSRTLAARAALELAGPDLAAFESVALTVPLADALAVKRERMERALAAYQRASGYGVDEVVTAATHAIGSIYAGFSRALMESERPPGLSDLELEQYDILLEEQAFPIEEKAIEVFEANASRAPDGVYDASVAASFAMLAELLPVRYAKEEQGVNVVQAID